MSAALRLPSSIRHRLLVAAVLLCVLGCTSGNVDPTAASATAEESEHGKFLPMLQSGVWQQFKLPDAWVRAHLPEAAPRAVYLTLRPPNVGDYAVFTPCAPPPQILVGVVDQDQVLRESLVACPDPCDETGGAPELWGYRTQLLGITVGLLEDGSLDVAAHYRRRSDDPAPLTGPARFTAITTEAERVRWHRITPAQVRAAVQENQPDATCSGLLNPD